MSKHTASAIVPYTQKQMYDLVIDMDRYPEFLPWCIKARKSEETETQFLSEMTVAFKGIRETFKTMDYLEPGNKIIIRHLSGPFRHLESTWIFKPHGVDGSGCQIDFMINFQFNNPVLNFTLGPVFAQASTRMVAAFKDRAAAIYG
ncbi:MAG: type II toxin-antitoxin system RatA family toxin [Magnetococcus sp. DMHC-6]